MIVVYDEAGNILYARPGSRAPADLPPGQRALVVPAAQVGQVVSMRVDVHGKRLVLVDPGAAERRRRMEIEGWERLRRAIQTSPGPVPLVAELEALRRRVEQLERRMNARATPDPTSSAGGLGG